MVKFLSIFALKPGYDPEETHRLWVEEHVPYVKREMAAELRGYVIGRVLYSLTGGEFYGAVQLTYDNLADALRAQGRTLTENPPDEFMNRLTDHRRLVIQEHDIVTPPRRREMIKIISTLSLKPGYDPDETFELWIREHVPYVKSIYPKLEGYVIGRVLKSITGGEFYGAVQLSFSEARDAIRDGKKIFANPPDEFMNRTTNVRRVVIQEADVFRCNASRLGGGPQASGVR
jgi:hypothetical protein